MRYFLIGFVLGVVYCLRSLEFMRKEDAIAVGLGMFFAWPVLFPLFLIRDFFRRIKKMIQCKGEKAKPNKGKKVTKATNRASSRVRNKKR